MSCNIFQFTDQSDSFETWQGLRGPKGDPGPEGPPGQGLVIQGIVATVGDLPASANQGDVWLVGASDPYEGYLWTDGAWEDIGELAMGPQGPAGTITVGTVTGLPAGSTPTVVNTGTAENAVLDFGIPEGAQGESGPTGPGVASGGTTGQVLAKASGTDYDTEWITQSRGVNRNLLDNWYFVKGTGTTGNYGIFPVNQRAQSSYSTLNAYTIDRWKLTSGTLIVDTGGITLNGTITQILPDSIGLTVTASALLSDGTMITPTYNDSTKTFTLTAAGETIVAAKLELGNTQTLAHLEGSTWILNEIPSFSDELSKASRYLYKIGQYMYWKATRVNENTIDFIMPTLMKGQTCYVRMGSLNVFTITGAEQSNFTVNSIQLNGEYSNFVRIRMEKTAHGLTDALLAASPNFVLLSCEP